jgi:hypothetical protein
MKNTKVTLYQWQLDLFAPREFFDIDWPQVHKECGIDHIEWINNQPDENCQLSLELFEGGRRLIVEFFNKDIATTYHLMWAK